VIDRANFLDSTLPLTAADATAAIILGADGRYLLQQRDDKPEIFYPGHWGLFGGAMEPGETPAEGLARELREELGLATSRAEKFVGFRFDLSALAQGTVERQIFVVRLSPGQERTLTLGEGRAMRFFAPHEWMPPLPMVPYDSFALWLYHSRARFAGGR
jgi:8-oxo-dGTP pyrophosphatase MutT (NUDIX family)